MPFSEKISDFANNNNMKIMRKIGSTWTGAACIQMFTGKMLSDIHEHGIGYRLKQQYQQKTNKKKQVNWPWKNQILLHTFLNNNWNIQYHNGGKFNEYLLSEESIIQSPRFVKNRKTIISSGKKSEELMRKELKYIRDIQKNKEIKDMFHFIRYEHYHDSFDLVANVIKRKKIKIEEEIKMYWERRNKKQANLDHCYDDSYINNIGKLKKINREEVKNVIKNSKKRSLELMKAWDINEPNAIFCFFADHGDINLMQDIRHPDPPMYYTWIMIKDNTKNPINIKTDFISDRDFFTTLSNKFNYNYPSFVDIYGIPICDTRSIELDKDENRVYYIEDGRRSIDSYRSTTAIACQLVDWKNNKPRGILQVSYHSSNKEWKCGFTLLDEKSFCGRTCNKNEIDEELKKKLIKRFKWGDC